jgi:polysaccharide export outer membrane protein
MKKRVSMLVTLAVAAALAGCTGYRTPPPAFHEVLNKPYVLDSGDRVRVIVYEQPDLTNTYSVDQDRPPSSLRRSSRKSSVRVTCASLT